jgi:hypothetical protein
LIAVKAFEKLSFMASSICIKFEAALYHIMARGNRREARKIAHRDKTAKRFWTKEFKKWRKQSQITA